MIELNTETIRGQFPALQRQQNGQPVVYLDGPAGTQVPRSVVEAMSNYMYHTNANHGEYFETSRESDHVLDQAHLACADFVGSDNPDEIYFGQNMTSLTFAMSRSLAKTWSVGDEILVTRLDHDANIAPWVSAAAEVGAIVKFVEMNKSDYSLDMQDFENKLSEKTRLVAVGAASNATGGINPVQQIVQKAHAVGALVFVDAVHYGPHGLIDVKEWECDFLSCSAYKFFGPHVGIMWAREGLLRDLVPFKVRPSTDELPGRWMTGTQNHEGIVGVMAAIDYLANVGNETADSARRANLRRSFELIRQHENALASQMLDGLASINDLQVYGISDSKRLDERFATVSITHPAKPTSQLAAELADRGIFVWHGNYYALEFTESLDLEPEGMVRMGLVHYNTTQEVDRVIATLSELLSPARC